MTRDKNKTLTVTSILLAFVLLLVPGVPAVAQDTGQPVLELRMEIQQKDLTYIYAGPELIRYLLTADTMIFGPDGNTTSLGAHIAPFMADVKYSLPADGGEGSPPVAVEIRILEEQPQ